MALVALSLAGCGADETLAAQATVPTLGSVEVTAPTLGSAELTIEPITPGQEAAGLPGAAAATDPAVAIYDGSLPPADPDADPAAASLPPAGVDPEPGSIPLTPDPAAPVTVNPSAAAPAMAATPVGAFPGGGDGSWRDAALPVDPVSAVGDYAIVATALGASIVAYSLPTLTAPVVGTFANPVPSGAPLVFDVVAQSGSWLQVSLPVRPNGSTGWVPADAVSLARNRYRIEVDATGHHLVVFRDGEAILDTPVGIGTGETPTPIGVFYLVELLAPPDPAGAYGPYAFGLSGYSETLASFNGGAGVIGIHGTNDPTSLGRDSSHGCIRVANDVIIAMAGYLPLGTPVVISR